MDNRIGVESKQILQDQLAKNAETHAVMKSRDWILGVQTTGTTENYLGNRLKAERRLAW